MSRVAGNHPVGGHLFDEPQRDRLRRGHEPGHDRRAPGSVHSDSWALQQRQAGPASRSDRGRLDPGRIVYHHCLGQSGLRCTPVNFYTNMAPLQELDDWFEHWATAGVKPLFTCEYMVPCTWDWTMYRGWYKGQREFGSAVVPWEFCVAEWSSQFLGDRAYQISEAEKQNLRWEAEQFRDGRLWHRWDYPYPRSAHACSKTSTRSSAQYLTQQLACFPHLGRLGHLPVGTRLLLDARARMSTRAASNSQVDWDQPPAAGFQRRITSIGSYERMDLAFQQSDWIPTADGQAILRNNRPLLAYIAGKPAAFTSKDHNFVPGETVEKQLIIINNSRETVTCECQWSLALPQPISGTRTSHTGHRPTGADSTDRCHYRPRCRRASTNCSATVEFSNGETQDDELDHPRAAAPGRRVVRPRRIALFDPQGETATLLTAMGIDYQPVEADGGPVGVRHPCPGQGGADGGRAGAEISTASATGLKVLVFEQTSEALGKAVGVPHRGVRLAASVPARTGPSAAGGSAGRTPPRLAGRGNAPAAQTEVRTESSNRRRPDGQVVRPGGLARLALRQPRQCGLAC